MLALGVLRGDIEMPGVPCLLVVSVRQGTGPAAHSLRCALGGARATRVEAHPWSLPGPAPCVSPLADFHLTAFMAMTCDGMCVSFQQAPGRPVNFGRRLASVTPLLAMGICSERAFADWSSCRTCVFSFLTCVTNVC